MTPGKPLPIEALNSHRIADRILKDIKDLIVQGALPKGAKLPTERDLAERYGVSGPTVREAIRGLSAIGLITVRHGSGAYVAADATSLVATSLGAVIQLEKLGIAEILSTSGCMTVQAARLAAEVATGADKALLFLSLEQLVTVSNPTAAATALRAFHEAIVVAAHNPLLRVLNGFLTDLIIELSHELMGDDLAAWRRILNKMKPLRADLVEAIVSGDVQNSMLFAEAYHHKAAGLVLSVPKAKEARLKDPQFQSLLLRLVSGLGAR